MTASRVTTISKNSVRQLRVQYFLILLSPASLASNQIQTEVFIAHEASKAVHAG